MALESPMMPTDHASQSSFYLSNSSPASPVPFKRFSQESSSRHKRSSGSQSGSISAMHRELMQQPPPSSPYPQYVDPSPVDSNGTASTEATEIEDDDADDIAADGGEIRNKSGVASPRITSASPISPDSMLARIDTSLAARTRADSDAPQSVIHAPQGHPFDTKKFSPTAMRQASVSPTESNSKTIVSPNSPEFPAATKVPIRASLNTDVPPVSDKILATPRAQTRDEFEDEQRQRTRRRSSLEGMLLHENPDCDFFDADYTQEIPEGADNEHDEEDEFSGDPPEPLDEMQNAEAALPQERQEQIQELKDCLTQAWGLCTTFSSLSHNHRNRIFKYRGKTEIQGQAWRSCWKLCQHLYESREGHHDSEVITSLDLCREFCHALFDARVKGDELSDSVFRVSFELNTHLYNAHDRALPISFQIRTLDFYLTLCHRMMKLPTSLPVETDQLLRACWHLVEMLFSLRQNNRERKAVDEDVLTAAIEACYDLTDLFREGWSQKTFSRGASNKASSVFSQSQTSYVSQKTYSDHSSPPLVQPSLPDSRSVSRASVDSYSSRRPPPSPQPQFPPETPTTVFDDTNDTVEMLDDDNAPNILVLGPQGNTHSSASSTTSSSYGRHHTNNTRHPWSSAGSSFSESSQRTSSTATVSGSATNINRLRVLLVFAAKSEGWQPRSYSSSTSGIPTDPNLSLLTFIRAMPSTAFGESADMKAMLERYKRMITDWPLLAARAASPANNGLLVQRDMTKITNAECGRAILWMMRNSQYSWLENFFRRYLKCSPEDALRDSVSTIEA